ncbi:hypothetical protein KM043_011140 [Ampulex compressa]|nr:hypothetical protein KM043_011140 [Ampulex compressa]
MVSSENRRRETKDVDIFMAAHFLPDESTNGEKERKPCKRRTRVATSHRVNTTADLEQPWAEGRKSHLLVLRKDSSER